MIKYLILFIVCFGIGFIFSALIVSIYFVFKEIQNIKKPPQK